MVVADHVPDAISTVQISRLPTNQMAINSSLGTHTYRQTTAQSLPRVALDGLIRAMIQRRTDPPFAPLNLSPPSISHFAPPPPPVSSAIFRSLYRSYSAFFVCFSGIGPLISVNSCESKAFTFLLQLVVVKLEKNAFSSLYCVSQFSFFFFVSLEFQSSF